ncbi:MAG TPA: hypothetical protein VM580_00830, partial [Labilithrix sp.]|nr:hypothetical protein [Labilithrix sp.]
RLGLCALIVVAGGSGGSLDASAVPIRPGDWSDCAPDGGVGCVRRTAASSLGVGVRAGSAIAVAGARSTTDAMALRAKERNLHRNT